MNSESLTLFCRPQMGGDEYVLWHGCPSKQGRLLSGTELRIFLFCILWTVLGTAMAIAFIVIEPDPTTFVVLLFPVIGGFLIATQLRRLLCLRNHTEYVITNKRLYRRMGKKVDSYAACMTQGFQIQYHPNGNATIRFPMIVDPGAGTMRSRREGEIYQYVALINIEDPDRVEQALVNMSVES
ncbi:MAG: hypothetical protein IKM59_06495 [Oscillospiraceae bacterium]|nr:hypothetical protein [Oscillospiraceae bacterium]